MEYVLISAGLLITVGYIFRKPLVRFFVGGENPPNDDEENDA